MIQRASESDMDGWPEEHQQMAVEVLYAFDMFLLAAGCASNAGLELARDRIVIERLTPVAHLTLTDAQATEREVYRGALGILAMLLDVPEHERMTGKGSA